MVSIHREKTIAWGTRKVLFPDHGELNEVLIQLGDKKRVWIWEHDDKEIARTQNKNEMQILIEQITAVHNGVFRLYHDAMPNVPEDGAVGKTLAYELNLKVSDVYNFVFDDAVDLAPLRINMPRSVKAVSDIQWIYQTVPSKHQETESFLYLKELFNKDDQVFIQELDSDLKWRLYGLSKVRGRYEWTYDQTKFLDSDGLPPSSEWLVNQVNQWSDFDQVFDDNLLLLFELKAKMMPYAFKMLSSQTGDLILERPSSGLYFLLTRRNRMETTPWVIQMSQEVQVLDRNISKSLSKHVIDHGSFSVVQFTSPTKENQPLQPNNVVLSAPSQRQVYWHVMAIDQFEQDWEPDKVIEWMSAQKGWSLGEPVQEGSTFKLTNQDRAKKEDGLLICAFEYYNTTKVTKTYPDVPADINNINTQTFDQAIKRKTVRDDSSFRLVVPRRGQEEKPKDHAVYVRRLVTTVYLPPVCTSPVLDVQPVRVATPDQVKLVIPTDVERSQMFKGIRNQIVQEQRLEEFPGGGRSTPIMIAIQRIINNRKNAAAFMETVPRHIQLEKMSRAQLAQQLRLHSMTDDTDAFWNHPRKKEYVAIHPGRMEGIKLFDMDPRKGLTQEGAIWLRMSPDLAQIGVEQFLKNVSYEPLLYRALELSVKQNELLAKQRAERMIRFGLSTTPYYSYLKNRARDPKAEIMMQRVESLDQMYRMLYQQDISREVRQLTASMIDSEYVKPLLTRPEKEHKEFARQFWELPIRLFPNHITYWDTSVTFLTQEQIKETLWTIVEFVPITVEREHLGLVDTKIDPKFIRLFWIKMFLESTPEEKTRIKNTRSTFFLPGNPPLSKSTEFNNKRVDAWDIDLIPTSEDFFKKYMFEDTNIPPATLREWPDDTMPLFESKVEELVESLQRQVLTPDQIPDSNPNKMNAVDFYKDMSQFIDEGRLIAIRAIRNEGVGLFEHQRALAWAGFQSLVLANIKKYWDSKIGRVSLVDCEDSIPLISSIEEGMITLGIKKINEDGQRALVMLDSNMLLLLDDEWDDPFYQEGETKMLYGLVLVDDELRQLAEEIREGLDVREKSANYYQNRVDFMQDAIRRIEDFRRKIDNLFEGYKANYAKFLEEQVKKELKMETIRKIGTDLAQMTKPGASVDIGQKDGKQAVINITASLKEFNEMTFRAIDVKSGFEKLWKRLEEFVVEQSKKVTDHTDIQYRVMEDETTRLTTIKDKQLVYYIEINERQRREYVKKMMEESQKMITTNAAQLVARKKEEENKDMSIRLLDEFEKATLISVGRDTEHPLENYVPDITQNTSHLAWYLKDFYNYVAARATNLSKFRDSFKMFQGIDLEQGNDVDQKLETFFAPEGEVIKALYLIASDNRYNLRLVQNTTQPGLTLAHILFHRFVHLINGLFIIVEQNFETLKDRDKVEKLQDVRNEVRDLIGKGTGLYDQVKDPVTNQQITPADEEDFDSQLSLDLEKEIREKPMDVLNKTVVYLDKEAKERLSYEFQQSIKFFTADPKTIRAVDEFAMDIYHKVTERMYITYYQPNYEIMLDWLRKNGKMQDNSFMRRDDITPMQSRFFRPNSNEPSGLSAAINTFLGMDPDKERDQTSLSRMIWEPHQDKLQEDDRQKKERQEKMKEYKFLRPLCGREEDKGDVEQKTKRDEMTQDMLCPRKMLDLANAGLLWAIGDFYEKGPSVVEQIPRGSFFNLISRLLDSVEFFNMRMRFGLDPSMDKTQHAYAYKLGATMSEDDQNPFITTVGSRDLAPNEGYTEIDEEFAREVLNSIEAEQKGAIKPIMDMAPRYNMTRDAAHELWRLALFGRITSPHVMWTKDAMKLKDGLLLLDFVVELDKYITAAVKKDEALSSFQLLSLLQSVWAFLKFYIMPRRAYENVFLQQLHQDGRIIYDYFSPYAITSLLRNQFTYNLQEISSEPITWQWMVKFYSLEEPFALPKETLVGRAKNDDQRGARNILRNILSDIVFYYTGEDGKGQGVPYQRILGQWDRSHDPFDPSTDLITGSGFVYTRDERWKFKNANAQEEIPWITVSPFAGLDTIPYPPEFPHGRDASYNVNTTMFETEDNASIYEWRAGRRLYMRPSVFNTNLFRPVQDLFFNWNLGSTNDLISGQMVLQGRTEQWHLWPVLITENHSLISWFNEWERKLDNHPSLLGFYRLFTTDSWKPTDQIQVDEPFLLIKRKEKLKSIFLTRVNALKEKIKKALEEFQEKTNVSINVISGDLLGETLQDLQTKDFDLDEKEVSKLNNEITKAEHGFEDFSARLKEWSEVFVQTFNQNESVENNPDVTGLEEDPSILDYYFKEYSEYSPFPKY